MSVPKPPKVVITCLNNNLLNNLKYYSRDYCERFSTLNQVIETIRNNLLYKINSPLLVMINSP